MQTSPAPAVPEQGTTCAPGHVPTCDAPGAPSIVSSGASSEPAGTPTESVARSTVRSRTPSLVTGSETVTSTTELGGLPFASGPGGSPESVAREGYMRRRTR